MQRDCGSKSIDLAGMLVVSFDKVSSNLRRLERVFLVAIVLVKR